VRRVAVVGSSGAGKTWLASRLAAALGVPHGNYSSKGGDLVRERADTVVWLDFPRPTVMRQLVLRTARRVVLRTRLWNDNRESLRDALSRDPERSVVRWSWIHHEPQRAAFAAQADDRWVRLTSRAEVQRFLAARYE
jgi:adenylate kinase family enzyme